MKYVDHMHYTLPLQTGKSDGFTFPSEYIGQYGVFDAVRHIYSKNSSLAHLLSDSGNELNVSKKYFTADLEKGIENVRDQFREKHQLNDDQTVIFFAPGNERAEAEFCTENVRRGVKEFLLKYSAPTSLSPKALPKENFVTVISLQ